MCVWYSSRHYNIYSISPSLPAENRSKNERLTHPQCTVIFRSTPSLTKSSSRARSRRRRSRWCSRGWSISTSWTEPGCLLKNAFNHYLRVVWCGKGKSWNGTFVQLAGQEGAPLWELAVNGVFIRWCGLCEGAILGVWGRVTRRDLISHHGFV